MHVCPNMPVFLKALEKIYHCKDESLTMEDVHEDILRYLSEDAEFAKWNITTASMKYASFKHGKCQLDESFDTRIDISTVDNKAKQFIFNENI